MRVTPGPFAPRVTQWVAGTPTKDAEGSEVPTFTPRPIRALAAYPGQALETDNASQDTVIADFVLLLQPSTAVKSTDEWTLTNAKRYKVLGDPGPYVHPVTGTAVTQVNLRRIS